MAYTKTGPFVNAGAPGISAPFLNNVENSLAAMFVTGNIARIAFGFSAFTTTGATITHNLGVAPSGVFVTVAGVAGVTYFINGYASTTTMIVQTSANCNGWWLVIA